MSLGTSNRDGGRTSESGHLRAIMKGLKAQVLTGLSVSQRGAGANMSVDVAIGDAIIPRSDATYGHPSFNDAVYNQAITTADVSNPRRDIVVMYIDYGQTPSTGVSNNTNGVVKIAVIAGTPAGSPSDPSNAAIQSAVGASNPYIKLARVRVAAGASSITNSVIDDLRLLASGLKQGGWIYDDLYTWTYVSATSFAIAGVDVRSQFPVGTKLALYQSGSIKYFTVVSSAFSTNTTVTVDGQGTYTLANVPVDKPAFSYELHPVGFPDSESNIQFSNPYKFFAFNNANLAIVSGAKARFNAEVYDTNSNFDSATNYRYVAPVSGYYEFSSNVNLAFVGANYAQLQLMKNGAAFIQGGFGYYSGAGSWSANCTAPIFLNAGDYVEVSYQGANGTLQGGASSPYLTWFAGKLTSRI